MDSSETHLRVSVPSQWRQVSFICFDLGVLNVIGGVGAAAFHSPPLSALGFSLSSFWLGLFLIVVGFVTYNLGRLPSVIPIIILTADALNTLLFLPRYQLAAGVVLVKISLVFPFVLNILQMLRVRLKLRSPKQEREPFPPRIGPGKAMLALLSSMFVSVGAGMTALLLFVVYALPAVTQSSKVLINIFHDLFIVPALLLLFPLGAAVGELVWTQASRIYLRRNEVALFIRYLEQLPFFSKLAEKIAQSSADADEVAITPQAAIIPSWRKYLLPGTLALIPIFAFAILILTVAIPAVLSGPASAEGITPAPPGALIVSQSGDGQYRNINDAVAAASAGATILVRPGVYRERVIIDKDITLIGDRGGVTVQCYDDGCLTITTRNANISNLTVVTKIGLISLLLRPKDPAAILVLNGRTVIEECDVSSNGGAGIVVLGSDATAEIKSVKAHDCRLNGILFTNGGKGVVENSDIYRNKWAGIRSDNGGNVTVRRSRMHSGKMDGVLVDIQGAATLEDCEIFGNEGSGVHAREGSSVFLGRSRTFKNGRLGVMVHDQSFAKVDACDVHENKRGGIEVTDESDAQVFNTKVHNEETCAIAIENNSTATIEGATVYENALGLIASYNAKPIVRKSVFRSHLYSAIEVNNGADPMIEQSQIYSGQNSGIYFYEGGLGRVNDCAIFGYMKSNIVIRSGSNPRITKTKLTESGYAGVLVTEGGQGSVTDCQIFNNHLGIELRTNSSLSVQGSKLTGNANGAWRIDQSSHVIREGNTE